MTLNTSRQCCSSCCCCCCCIGVRARGLQPPNSGKAIIFRAKAKFFGQKPTAKNEKKYIFEPCSLIVCCLVCRSQRFDLSLLVSCAGCTATNCEKCDRNDASKCKKCNDGYYRTDSDTCTGYTFFYRFTLSELSLDLRLLLTRDVKSSRPKWPRGQNCGLCLGLGLKALASASALASNIWPRPGVGLQQKNQQP